VGIKAFKNFNFDIQIVGRSHGSYSTSNIYGITVHNCQSEI